MSVVNSSDIVLAYMVKKQEVARDGIIPEISDICKKLAEQNVYTTIDFKYFNDKIISDTIIDNLWYFISSDIIEEHSSEVIYKMTEYGNSISNYLLQNFRENQNQAWVIFNTILG